MAIFDFDTSITVKTALLGVKSFDFVADDGNRIAFTKVFVLKAIPEKQGKGHEGTEYKTADLSLLPKLEGLIGETVIIIGEESGSGAKKTILITDVHVPHTKPAVRTA